MREEFFLKLLHWSNEVHDSGPIYHEFHEHSLIKEPWNAASSLFFLVPVFYWFWKLKGQYKEHIIITSVLPLLLLNGIGSTLFHAFRTHNVWLIMDFLPALLMMLVVGVHFWSRVLGSWKKGLLVIPGVFLVLFSFSLLLNNGIINIPRTAAPNVFYTLNGLCVIGIPTFIILYRTKGYKWHLIALTALFLIGAIVFRSLDYSETNPHPPEWLPQGTHFLWHIVSAFAVFSLGWYLYYLKDVYVGPKHLTPPNDDEVN